MLPAPIEAAITDLVDLFTQADPGIARVRHEVTAAYAALARETSQHARVADYLGQILAMPHGSIRH